MLVITLLFIKKSFFPAQHFHVVELCIRTVTIIQNLSNRKYGIINQNLNFKTIKNEDSHYYYKSNI